MAWQQWFWTLEQTLLLCIYTGPWTGAVFCFSCIQVCDQKHDKITMIRHMKRHATSPWNQTAVTQIKSLSASRLMNCVTLHWDTPSCLEKYREDWGTNHWHWAGLPEYLFSHVMKGEQIVMVPPLQLVVTSVCWTAVQIVLSMSSCCCWSSIRQPWATSTCQSSIPSASMLKTKYTVRWQR